MITGDVGTESKLEGESPSLGAAATRAADSETLKLKFALGRSARLRSAEKAWPRDCKNSTKCRRKIRARAPTAPPPPVGRPQRQRLGRGWTFGTAWGEGKNLQQVALNFEIPNI
ncbi:hypothetical protein CERZMDRAFT_96949 [Cercospora zeae-maydis SCOH1-5]|uniref:Uncharacterized protein n=1 Tax=Cercospora zeae-maydis SCOH1-5 TaxID=717836 RepID=A0A6A6FJ83_9PEZI|nr:hypothetical protein CERZMDRAFT_96949 [Cercospora zeae-maydis SCOH1-5]